MTDWPRVLQKGWPGVGIRTDAVLERGFPNAQLAIRRRNDPTILSRTIEIDGIAIEWGVLGPMPTEQQLRDKAAELAPAFAAEDERRLRMRAFRQKWPHDRIITSMDDPSLRAEFIADARAAR